MRIQSKYRRQNKKEKRIVLFRAVAMDENGVHTKEFSLHSDPKKAWVEARYSAAPNTMVEVWSWGRCIRQWTIKRVSPQHIPDPLEEFLKKIEW